MPPSKLVFYHVKQPIHPHQCTLHVWLSLCLKAQASFLFSPLCQPLPLLLPLPKISTVLFVLSLDRKPLHGGGQTAVGVQCCGVCVCVCVWEEKNQREKKGVSFFLLSSSPTLWISCCLFRLFLPTLCVQARRELRRLKEEARQKHAVAVIWAYWQGLKVPAWRGPVDLLPTWLLL